ncbi:putative ABC transport system permease protein [Geoalkalibacter ferrihydriticus]|uniref:Macrolide export ATP-binding/permease MacB n=2 Tax=Geoalkalibacter ferrihydriticus TaxID=392333 RepID=A0A0C2HXH9_9BACT|nr:ABC transporter permease [Geoalkalibacter ferrihydriticus]KIH77472.1 macrolide export ATP-binding/permease MacB [Geoalkalibacter ferrihydriticus DSM 17813]SDM13580.1 putative ABC transport system permease protein [Geoalkalibacter ferrihydriticus]
MRELKIVRNIRLGIKNLVLNGLRSLLTMLGMVFGVGSVIAMLSVGEGASQEALEQIRRLGSENILISSIKPVEEESSPQVRILMSMYGLTYQDEQRIRETFDAVRTTVPVKAVRKEARLGARAMETRLMGVTPEWFDLVQRPLLAGRFLSYQDEENHAAVVVVTEAVARNLLPLEHPLGSFLQIGGEVFEVVGIVESLGEQTAGVQAPDRQEDVYLPLSTTRERYGDMTVRRSAGSFMRERVELHQIIVRVDDIENVEATAQAIEEMLGRFHRQKDYRIDVPLALLRQAEATKRTFNIVLGSIAGISLLVGGIGIMNIMLASVTERTREIGIRRAIGAKRRQIVGQFLIETVVLSCAGGMIGIGVGVLIPHLITYFAGLTTVVTAGSLILSVVISLSVGIIFGLYPAVRAARLDPIDALRHE